MIDKPSPSFEMALQEERMRVFLRGMESGDKTGYKRGFEQGVIAGRRMERKCENACGFQEPYGFVPEADCPVHDRPLTKEQDSDKIKDASESS